MILLFWVFCAIFPARCRRTARTRTDLLNINKAPSSSHWFGTDQLGRDMFARVIAGARDVIIIAPLATLLGTILGTAIGLVMGYFRGAVDDVISRFVEAFLALPLVITGILGVVALGSSIPTMIIIIGIVFTPLIARTVRAAVLLERDLDYVHGREAPRRVVAVHHVRRDPPERDGADRRRVHGPARLRGVHARVAVVPRASASARRRRTGARTSARTTAW